MTPRIPGYRKPTKLERFWAKVVPIRSGCWIWTGCRITGYAKFWDGRNVQASRFAWELIRGPVPKGLHLDHLCRNRNCVNPWHLDAVTQAENNRRGWGSAGLNSRKTHCIRGHKFSPENTYHPGGDLSRRQCRKCIEIRSQTRDKEKHVEYQRRYLERKAAAA